MDQILITKKTELAFNTQTELVIAKNEIIENHKFIIWQLKKQASDSTREVTQNLTSHIIANIGVIENINGVQDCCEFIRVHATNGVLLNGLLLWPDMQWKVTPENIWKAQAVKKFDSEEITGSKGIVVENSRRFHHR